MNTNKFNLLIALRAQLFSRAFSSQNTADVIIERNLRKTPSKIKTSNIPAPLYGGRRLVTMLPGSGVGPELTNHVRDVFKAAHVPIDFETVNVNQQDTPISEAVISIRRNGVAIKGNLGYAIDGPSIAPNVLLRTELDLYVYAICYKSYPNIKCMQPNLDIVLIRQNTEGEYAMLEHENVKGIVESMKIITRNNTERLARWAFDYAVANNRKKITVVHKARVMELADGLFLRTVEDIASEYPTIRVEDMYVDRCCRKLVTKPHVFDVLLMPNLYGTIVSNIICGLLGGAGLFSGRNLGEQFAVFEAATRHTGKDIAGKDMANPVAMLNASVDLLNYLGIHERANIIRDAIYATISENQIQTVDIGGVNSTSEVIDSIKRFIHDNISKYTNLF